MKALVLSGGKGRRLRPLTHTLPKQLIPIANRPILHYVVEQVFHAGISQVGVVVSPETGTQIRQSLTAGFPNLELTYISQPEPLGIAHAVQVARPFLGTSTFVLYLGDNLIGEEIRGFLDAFTSSGADAQILLKEVPDPRLFGVAELDGAGRVMRLVEKPQEVRSHLALVGVYFFTPRIHEAIAGIQPSQRGELEITDAIQKLLDEDRKVDSNILHSWWLDTGKKDDLLEANRIVLDEWVERDIQGSVDDATQVTGRVKIEVGSTVARSQVRGPAVIGQDTIVEDSFIGPYTSVGNGCTIRRSNLEHSVLMDGVQLDGVMRLEDSIVGRESVVRASGEHRHAVRLLIGDHAEVLV